MRATYKFLRKAREVSLADMTKPRRLYNTWRVLPYTMVSLPRLGNAYDCVRAAIREGVAGDIAECGVWAGGSAALMALAARDAGEPGRCIHLFDSFEGLPQPSAADGDAVINAYRASNAELPLDDGSRPPIAINACVAPLDLVRELFFQVLHIPEPSVAVHKGWFQETLVSAIESGQVKALAVLRLDGDWYESTRICLMHLYPLVQPGGFVTIDDYGCFEGCKKAVDEFIATLAPKPEIVRIDAHGVYFRKPRD